jgi:hypothetical protein
MGQLPSIPAPPAMKAVLGREVGAGEVGLAGVGFGDMVLGSLPSSELCSSFPQPTDRNSVEVRMIRVSMVSPLL